MEVILEKGDVLYIPPFWFHFVCVAGNSSSISVSTHSESLEANARELMISLALNTFSDE
jgi:ribosomal protein L16 Arg81 hydroxylase